jgi:hypothetical protein
VSFDELKGVSWGCDIRHSHRRSLEAAEIESEHQVELALDEVVRCRVRRVGRDRLGSPRIHHIATPRGRRAGTATLVVLYAAAWVLTSLVLKTTPSDLDLYFWPSAETVAGGHPLHI